jgi:hypothetical protein
MEQSLFCRDGSPLTKPEDLIPFLADKKQWREGRSACEAAYSWFDAKGLPWTVAAIIETDPTFSHAVLLKAIFEKQTELDSLGRPSQTDVLALLRLPTGLAILGIEAKVDESFGPIPQSSRRAVTTAGRNEGFNHPYSMRCGTHARGGTTLARTSSTRTLAPIPRGRPNWIARGTGLRSPIWIGEKRLAEASDAAPG